MLRSVPIRCVSEWVCLSSFLRVCACLIVLHSLGDRMRFSRFYTICMKCEAYGTTDCDAGRSLRFNWALCVCVFFFSFVRSDVRSCIENRREHINSQPLLFTFSLFWAVAIVCRRRVLDEKIIIYLCFFFVFSFLFLDRFISFAVKTNNVRQGENSTRFETKRKEKKSNPILFGI